MTDFRAIFTCYAEYFSTLQPSTTTRLRDLAVENLHFRDPFNDLYTTEETILMLQKMFEDTTDPVFEVTHIACCDQTAFLRWNFSFTPKSTLLSSSKTARRPLEPWKIVGVSEVRCNAEGKIVEHIDHWDSGRYFYERLPLLGRAVRFVRRRMAAGH